MIKYKLICNNKHEFESWFSDSKDFETLKKKSLLECIYCSSSKISKSIMSPMVTNKSEINSELIKFNKSYANEKKQLLEIRNYIENNFEFVGDNFSKKVREIYYDKKKKKLFTAKQQKKKERNCPRKA